MINIPTLSGALTHENLKVLLEGYSRPNDKISYMIENGTLIPVKRGLYLFNEVYKSGTWSEMQLANLLYGPSYVSSYSALAYYGLIPERVNRVESATIKRSKLIQTSVGSFKYFYLAPEFFYIGINYIQSDNRTAFLIASPTKALCDLIWQVRRLNIQRQEGMEIFLEDDLRFDLERLDELDMGELEICMNANRKRKQLEFLKQIIEATT